MKVKEKNLIYLQIIKYTDDEIVFRVTNPYTNDSVNLIYYSDSDTMFYLTLNDNNLDVYDFLYLEIQEKIIELIETELNEKDKIYEIEVRSSLKKAESILDLYQYFVFMEDGETHVFKFIKEHNNDEYGEYGIYLDNINVNLSFIIDPVNLYLQVLSSNISLN